MEVVTIDKPAKLAAEHINKAIAAHEGDTVCLLAGGSALAIVDYVKPSNQSECRTIFMMGDERGSRDAKINNSLQLGNLYPSHYVVKNLIFTVPEEGESLENFSSRISSIFTAETSKLNNPNILQILGVGSDGHTAGIFPMPENEFTLTYDRPDLNIVPVHLESLTIDSRASFTPNWILTKPNELIIYAVGEGKKRILVSLINEIKAIHERPAELIKMHKNAVIYTDLNIE